MHNLEFVMQYYSAKPVLCNLFSLAANTFISENFAVHQLPENIRNMKI